MPQESEFEFIAVKCPRCNKRVWDKWSETKFGYIRIKCQHCGKESIIDLSRRLRRRVRVRTIE